MQGRISLTILSVGFFMGMQPTWSDPAAERYQIRPPAPDSLDLLAPDRPSMPKNSATPIADSPFQQQATQALQSFEAGNQLVGLIAAMKAAQGLRTSAGDRHSNTTPILALQSILDRIHERNHITGKIISISPDGERLIVRQQNKLQVWNTSGRKLSELSANNAEFSPDGQLILTTKLLFEAPARSAPTGIQAQLWNRDGQLRARFPVLPIGATISFTPNGQAILLQTNVGKKNGAITLYNFAGQPVADLKYPDATVLNVKTSADGLAIAVQVAATPPDGSSRPVMPGDILIYSVTGQQTGKVRDQSEFFFAPDSQSLLTVNRSGAAAMMQRIDLSGKVIETLTSDWLGDRYIDQISPSGKYLLLKRQYEQGQFLQKEVWSITGTQVRELVPTDQPFSADGKKAVGVRRINGQVQVQVADLDWEALNSSVGIPAEVDQFARSLPSEDYQQPEVRFTPNGEQLIVVDYRTGKVEHWDISRITYGDIGAGTYVASRAFDPLTAFTIPNTGQIPRGLPPHPYLISVSPSEGAESGSEQMRLWDGMARNGIRTTMQLPGDVEKYYQISRLKFSQDNQRLEVSGDGDRQVLTIKDGALTGREKDYNRGFSPDTRFVTINDVERSKSQLQDAATGRLVKELDGIYPYFSPDSQRLVTFGEREGVNFERIVQIRIWDTGGRKLGEFEISSLNQPAIAWSEDGSTFAISSENANLASTIKIWRQGNVATVQRPEGASGSLQLNANGQRLIVRNIDPSHPDLLLSSSGEKIRELPKNGNITFTPNGSGMIFSPGVTANQAVPNQVVPNQVLLSAQTGEQIADLGNNASQFLYSKTGDRFLSFISSGRETGRTAAVKLTIYSDQGQRMAEITVDQTITETNLAQFEVWLSPSQDLIVVNNIQDGSVTLWNWQGKQVGRLAAKVSPDWSSQDRRIVFSPDQQKLAIAGDDGVLTLWDRTGRKLNSIEVVARPTGENSGILIPAIAFSPDGQSIAAIGAKGDRAWTAHLWRLDGQKMAEWRSISQERRGLVLQFSPNGQQLAAADSGNTVYIWQVSSLDQLLQRGCSWLQPYLTSHPETQLDACKN